MNKNKRIDELKLCALSGTSEIGRNCNFLELGNEIVIVDAGYSFPGQEMYGIDYLIPNQRYLKKNKKKIFPQIKIYLQMMIYHLMIIVMIQV